MWTPSIWGKYSKKKCKKSLKKCLHYSKTYDIINLVAERYSDKTKYGSMVKRSRHRPFTAVTRVRFPVESLSESS